MVLTPFTLFTLMRDEADPVKGSDPFYSFYSLTPFTPFYYFTA